MLPIDTSTVFAMAPHFSGQNAENQRRIVDSFGKILQQTLADYDIDTPLRIAHFLAQTCHESAGFRTTEEFASGEAYEGRKDLGNTHMVDGPRYKGRGLIQLTGRANYRTYGKLLGVDLEGHPEAALDPQLSLKIACEYWKKRDINPDADRDDLITVTRKINGGTNGLEERRALLKKAKAAVAHVAAGEVAAATPGAPFSVLRRGSEGPEVATLQRMLQDQGFTVAIDGEFGPGTEVAVMRFQTRHNLDADGLVGSETWSALQPAANGAGVPAQGIAGAAPTAPTGGVHQPL
jgi:putative chitinase